MNIDAFNTFRIKRDIVCQKRGSALLAVISVSVFGFWGMPVHVSAASFDCGKASTPVETAICGDQRLGSLDQQVAQAYKQAGANKKAQQRAWLKYRNTCGANIECLTAMYEDRIAFLEKMSSPRGSGISSDTGQSTPNAQTQASVSAGLALDQAMQITQGAASAITAEREAEAAAAARAQEQRAKDDLLNYIFAQKWEVAGLPCDFNGGAYQIFSPHLKTGWNMAAGGKLIKETGNDARFSIEALDEKTFRHVMAIYSGGNDMVTRALGSPNARMSYTVDEYTLIDEDTLRRHRLDHRQINFDLMLKGVYREEVGTERGKISTIRACR